MFWFGLVVLVIWISTALATRRPTRPNPAMGPKRPVIGAADPARPPSISDFVTTLPRQSGADDVLVDLNGDGHQVALFDGRTRALRWRAGTFGSLHARDVIADAQRAYVADQSRVSAIRLADGQILWQSSLVSDVNDSSSCEGGCFAVVKDQILALERDGSLQSFDAATGRQLWDIRIPGRPDRFSVVGNSLAVNRATNSRGGDRAVDILDEKTGQARRTLQPSCFDKVFHRPQRPGSSLRELFSTDGNVAYLFFGDFSKCVQAMNVSTGEKLWNSYLPGLDFNARLVMGKRRIVLGKGSEIVWSVETATGKIAKVVSDTETRFTPLYVVDDEVILHSAPSWDSNRVSLVAVDAASGTRLWQFPVSAGHASMSVDIGPGCGICDLWTRPTTAGFVVAQILPTQQLSIDVLDPKTGVSAGRKLLPADRFSTSVDLGDDLAWVRLSDRLSGFALPGVTPKYQFP